MKNSKLRKFLTASVMTFAFAIGSLTAIPAASANTGGGIGGGGGPGGAYDGFQWVSVAYGQKGRAYEKFVELSGWPRGTVEREVRGRVGNLQVCQNSNVIWFIASQGWTYNFTGWTWPSNPIVAGTIEQPRVAVGDRGASPAEVNAFKEWDRNSNGNRIGNTPGYTIICSGAFQKPDENWTTSSSRVERGYDTATVTHPYSWTTEVTPEISPTGNLKNQPAVVQKTEFAALYDGIKTNAGAGLDPATLRSRAAAAVAKDQSKDHAKVNLSEQNKKGLSEGGVLNVNEQTKFATISSSKETVTTIVTTCKHKRTWNTWTGNYNPVSTSCSDKRSSKNSSTSTKDASTQKNTGFWQILAVHCNRDEFNALLASDPTITRISGDDANKITAVVHSQKHSKRPEPGQVDFGDPTNTNPAKAKTGHKGFYDKECPFDCVPLPMEDPSTPEPGTLTGAVSDGVNTNSFEFFRDNNQREIEVQAWAPKNGVDGVNTYNAQEAKTTTITRWEEGTPSPDGSSGGMFSMETAEGEKLFQGKIDSKFKDGNGKLKKPRVAPVQTNWNSDWHHDPFLSIVNGHHTRFLLKSTWASDAGKPQILNFKWEYDPDVTSSIPVKGIGFGPGSSQVRGELGNVSVPIEGKCYGKFGTSALQNDNVAAFGANTGTGSVNNLDNGIMGEPVPHNGYNLSTNFVRSAGE